MASSFSVQATRVGLGNTATTNTLSPEQQARVNDPHRNPAAEAVPEIKALDSASQWERKNPLDYSPYVFTYAFAETKGRYLDHEFHLIHTAPLSKKERAEFVLATREFERVANVQFEDVGAKDVDTNIRQGWLSGKTMIEPASADIHRLNAAGRATYPGDSNIEFDPQDVPGEGPGSFSYKVQIHELGHKLGLKHPHENKDVDDNAALLLHPQVDNTDTTVMSYNNQQTLPYTLMPLDIAALQAKYGANMQPNLPNNTFVMNGKDYVGTLWNGNQPITLDASGSTNHAAATFDLNSGLGHFSAIAGEHVYTAYGAEVNKAIGAPDAPNLFIGNMHGGDTFVGGKRDNAYTVSGENNTAQFNPESGTNTLLLRSQSDVAIHNFKTGTQNADTLIVADKAVCATGHHEKDGSVRLDVLGEKRREIAHVTLVNFSGDLKNIAVLGGMCERIPVIDMGKEAEANLQQPGTSPIVASLVTPSLLKR